MSRTPHRIRATTIYLALVCLLLAPSFVPSRLARAAGGANGPAALVKDLDTRAAGLSWWGSVPSNLVSIGGTTYFSAQLDSTGFELWKTDGTATGTLLIKDIVPGPEDSRPYGFTAMNGMVYFSANSAFSSSRKLWRTDGTSAGTTLVKDIIPNSGHTSIYSLTNVNGTLFFLADNALGYGKLDLWKSDGTAAGTILVKQLNTTVPMLFNINGTVFFNVSDSSTGTELWKSDGTAAGTIIVKDIFAGPDSSYPANLTDLNGVLYFVAADGVGAGARLWKSDGTAAGTVLVDPTGTLPAPREMINVNGTLFFSAPRPQEFGQAWGIWKSDGTAAGTTFLKDVDPGFAGSTPSYHFTNANGTLYFVGRDAATGGELWKSDGSASGTLMVKDINPGSADSTPANLTMLNGVLFFSATQNYQTELWKTDGSAAGTLQVKKIAPGSSSSDIAFLINANGVLLFSANDTLLGSELWRSDGTEAGTTLVKDIDPDAGGAFGNNAPNFTDVNGTLFFAADAELPQRGLWKSDGTAAGTTLIKSFPTGQGVDTMPTNLTNVNGTLFFVADGGTTGRELWKSDGTANGTTLVKDINLYTANNAQITDLTSANGLLYFSADDGTHGNELWKSDGSANGTVMVKDINPGLGYSAPSDITLLAGTIYFGASDDSHGAELWQSDGTEAGTTLVKDINPGPDDAFAYGLPQMIAANDALYLVANNGTTGLELWKSDGSATGTTLIKDINPGSDDAFISGGLAVPPFKALNNMVFFAADDGTHGRELWKTDGTTLGTVLIKDIVPGTATSYPDWFAIANGRLLFSVESPIGNFDLWQSDGTTAGTSLVKASSPNDFKLTHGLIAAAGNTGKALFSAYNGPNGVELWQTDGTVAGTQLLQDIAAGPIPSNPERFILSGARMFFLADDHAHGRELWSLPLAAVAPSGSAQIAPAGGTATFANVDLSFPPNAVTTPITITYSGLVTPTQSLGGAHSAGLSFALEARDSAGRPITQFAQPYTLIISYTDAQLAVLGVAEADLNLAFWNGSAWVNVLPCAGCGVDTVNNRLTAVLDHFTEFALLSGNLPAIGDGKVRVYLPLGRR